MVFLHERVDVLAGSAGVVCERLHARFCGVVALLIAHGLRERGADACEVGHVFAGADVHRAIGVLRVGRDLAVIDAVKYLLHASCELFELAVGFDAGRAECSNGGHACD